MKTFAFYSVALALDSPISNVNNFYLAVTGIDEAAGTPKGGWKLIAYDLNAGQSVLCNEKICNDRLVHWSVARPTCMVRYHSIFFIPSCLIFIETNSNT